MVGLWMMKSLSVQDTPCGVFLHICNGLNYTLDAYEQWYTFRRTASLGLRLAPVFFYSWMHSVIVVTISPSAYVHVVGKFGFMSDINQPSLPTPLFFVLMPISVFLALSTVFRSTNSPDMSLVSHSVLPVLSLPYYWSFQLHIFLYEGSFSPETIPSGWLGSKHQLTN